MSQLDTLQAALESALGPRLKKLVRDRGEITVTVGAADYLAAATVLRDHADLKLEQLIDLCGVDYSNWKDRPWDGPRFCVVSHLLSVSKNWRVRLKVFAPDDDMPMVGSLSELWSSANWFEREAFDLYGIIFEATSTCAASSPTTASSATRSARISRRTATWRCATTPSRSA